MKAFLLAAGLGTRLRPLTDQTPKCLVRVDGKSMLEWWFRLMREHGVHEFLINTHHLSDQVTDFVGMVAPTYNLTPTVVHEAQLIGSAGTLRENFGYVEEEQDFLVLYADNLTNTNLTDLVQFHRSRPSLLTMALYRMDKPETRGIAELDESGRIVTFEEKPEKPRSDLANGGIYVASRKIKPHLEGAFDLGYDVLPKLLGSMYGMEMNNYLRDVGTLDSLTAANIEWPKVIGRE